jgi:hypothetical protein
MQLHSPGNKGRESVACLRGILGTCGHSVVEKHPKQALCCLIKFMYEYHMSSAISGQANLWLEDKDFSPKYSRNSDARSFAGNPAPGKKKVKLSL